MQDSLKWRSRDRLFQLIPLIDRISEYQADDTMALPLIGHAKQCIKVKLLQL